MTLDPEQNWLPAQDVMGAVQGNAMVMPDREVGTPFVPSVLKETLLSVCSRTISIKPLVAAIGAKASVATATSIVRNGGKRHQDAQSARVGGH